MAFTVTKTVTAWGDQRTVFLDVLADAATQNVDTGLGFIRAFSVGGQSMTTAAMKCYPNSGAGGTAIAGTLGISGVASGDRFFIICHGR